MKKFNFKNYIAFTLTEMMIVLLITAVIAVATTPIITSAISDSGKANMSVEEAADNPWRVATKYSGGGIFNLPLYSYSMTSIGLKPGANSSDYNNPALAIQSNNSNNFAHSSQLQILNNNVAYNISADEYQNFAIISNQSFSGTYTNTFLGTNNVFIGKDINNGVNGNAYYDKSVFIGNIINKAKSVNSVNIGDTISSSLPEINSVNIGSNIRVATDNGTENINPVSNVNIGHEAGDDAKGSYNVNIGHSAARGARLQRSVVIGENAGVNAGGNTFPDNMDNVLIGNGAGSIGRRRNSISEKFSGNVFIGENAGASFEDDTTSTNKKINTVAIGNNAATCSEEDCKQENSVIIGYYAATGSGYSNSNILNSVIIGSSAGVFGRDNSKSEGVIYIGASAGAARFSGKNNIAIGDQADRVSDSDHFVYNTENNISIGMATGSYSRSAYSIYMGYQAGYFNNFHNTDNNELTAAKYANVGIGYLAARGSEIEGYGKWVIGNGLYTDTLTYSSSINVWNIKNDTPQMMIGFVDRGTSNQTITLYAGHVYRGSSQYIDAISTLSDRRLKDNIVPSKHSIEDIRKISIYDYNMKDDIRKTPRIGIIAQEYRKIFPQDVSRGAASKKLAASSNWLIFATINAIKDVDKFIQNFQAELKAYINDFSNLKAKVAKLEKQAAQIEKENAQMRSHLAKINAKLK